ncbi:MAG: DUF6364 family protein [Spirochaetes bacterium]|nr:DUF6364 family protein [Spirochaetota bacterium]
MNTAVTLHIDKNVIKKAEIYAKNAKKPLSQLVEEYLLSISSNMDNENKMPLGPITSQLAGIIKLDRDINHKELLTDAITEKYL